MPYQNFPNYSPLRGTGRPKNRRYRMRSAQLGDGYEQLTEAGLNDEMFEVMPEWRALDKADRDVIAAFLAEHKSITPFNFTLEGGETVLVRTLSWTDVVGDGDLWSVTAELKRVYRADG